MFLFLFLWFSFPFLSAGICAPPFLTYGIQVRPDLPPNEHVVENAGMAPAVDWTNTRFSFPQNDLGA